MEKLDRLDINFFAINYVLYNICMSLLLPRVHIRDFSYVLLLLQNIIVFICA